MAQQYSHYAQQQPVMNNYFVPGFGISRPVIQTEIRYFCGPDAIVRPYSLHGRDGFLVTTSGPALTREQIEDIKAASMQYEERQAERASQAEQGWWVNQPVTVNSRRSS